MVHRRLAEARGESKHSVLSEWTVVLSQIVPIAMVVLGKKAKKECL